MSVMKKGQRSEDKFGGGSVKLSRSDVGLSGAGTGVDLGIASWVDE